MQELIDVVSTVGFPIAICLVLLVERNKAMKEMTTAINNLAVLIAGKCK